MKKMVLVGVCSILLMFGMSIISAQEESPLPLSYQLNQFSYEPQGWNNCGPATITNALSFYGYADNQLRAANWLKPDGEDKNVTPWEMASFVNTQVPEIPVFAKVLHGGSLETIKMLIANEFPIVIEAGYDPDPETLGWMGHYLLVSGYDDASNTFTTLDSYLGRGTTYEYDYINNFWKHFNYIYIVLYTEDREEELNTILDVDADEWQNAANALALAQEDARANQNDPFAWFNIGTSFVTLAQIYESNEQFDEMQKMYENAATAYDQARNLGLPWRMMWYQFGPFDAYYHVGRYDDMLTLAQSNLNDGGGHFVEETFYYAGLAREGKGESLRALDNYNAAIAFNPNYTPAIEARDLLQAQLDA